MTTRSCSGPVLMALGAALLLGGSVLVGAWAAAGPATAAPPVVVAAGETVTLAVEGMT